MAQKTPRVRQALVSAATPEAALRGISPRRRCFGRTGFFPILEIMPGSSTRNPTRGPFLHAWRPPSTCGPFGGAFRVALGSPPSQLTVRSRVQTQRTRSPLSRHHPLLPLNPDLRINGISICSMGPVSHSLMFGCAISLFLAEFCCCCCMTGFEISLAMSFHVCAMVSSVARAAGSVTSRAMATQSVASFRNLSERSGMSPHAKPEKVPQRQCDMRRVVPGTYGTFWGRCVPRREEAEAIPKR